MKRFQARVHVPLWLLLLAGAFLLPPPGAAAQSFKVAVGAASVAHLPGYMALDGGYFAKEGLDVKLTYIRGGPQTVAALVGGDVPFAQVYSEPLLAARLKGVDTVIIAGLINEPLFSLMVAPGIKRPEDLRGKRAGITTFGSATDLALRLTLKKWGLKPETDVKILQVHGVPEILGAMRSGAIQAGIISPPTSMVAMKAGFKELAFLPAIGVSFQHTTLATTSHYLENNRPVALRVLEAYRDAIERIKSDKEFTFQVLSRYMKTRDPQVLEYTYKVAAPLFRPIPYPTLKGIQATLNFMAAKDPKAAKARPQEFVDTSLLKEIERSGAGGGK